MSSQASKGDDEALPTLSQWERELAGELPGADAKSAAARFAARAPASYKDQTTPALAAIDLAQLS
ncbi:MAG TPA: hypothetical protein VMO88_09665, partial [Acidimicrobiales bacterium]|nr:hypothetical protein [Acidimicrobiales bacterium]